VRINRADSRDGSVLGRVVSDDGFHTTSRPQAGRQFCFRKIDALRAQ
jgi:hypothetical protein